MGDLQHSDVLVLHRLRYGEQDWILRCLAASEGVLTFIARESRNRAGTARQCLPGALLHIGWKSTGIGKLPRILSASPVFPQHTTFFDPVRYASASLVAESFHRFLPADQPCEEDYFNLAYEVMHRIENEDVISDLPLVFLSKLCRLAGIAPVTHHFSPHCCFDLAEAHWYENDICGEATLTGEDALWWHRLFSGNALPPTTRSQRQRMLQHLCRFIQLHHDTRFVLNTLKSYSEIL